MEFSKITEREKIIKELESLNLVFMHKPEYENMPIEMLKRILSINKEIIEGCYD